MFTIIQRDRHIELVDDQQLDPTDHEACAAVLVDHSWDDMTQTWWRFTHCFMVWGTAMELITQDEYLRRRDQACLEHDGTSYAAQIGITVAIIGDDPKAHTTQAKRRCELIEQQFTALINLGLFTLPITLN